MRPSSIAILCCLPVATCVTPATEDVANTIGSVACSAPLAISLAPSPVTVALQTTAHLTAIVTTTAATAGTATVSLTATDAITHAAVTGWTITAAQAVALPATGAVLVGFDVTVPGDSASISVDLNAHATLGALVADAPGHVDVIKRITIVIPASAGTGSPHPGLGPQNLNVRAGTVVDFVNADVLQHVIHGSGGILHEATTSGFPGTTFTVTVTASGTWYCHTHESSAVARTITVVP
jgi:hypothetical protein